MNVKTDDDNSWWGFLGAIMENSFYVETGSFLNNAEKQDEENKAMFTYEGFVFWLRRGHILRPWLLARKLFALKNEEKRTQLF